MGVPVATREETPKTGRFSLSITVAAAAVNRAITPFSRAAAHRESGGPPYTAAVCPFPGSAGGRATRCKYSASGKPSSVGSQKENSR